MKTALQFWEERMVGKAAVATVNVVTMLEQYGELVKAASLDLAAKETVLTLKSENDGVEYEGIADFIILDLKTDKRLQV